MLHDILHESRKLRVKRAEAVLRRIDSGQIKEASTGKQRFGARLLNGAKGFFRTPRRPIAKGPTNTGMTYNAKSGTITYDNPRTININGSDRTVKNIHFVKDPNNPQKITEIQLHDGTSTNFVTLSNPEFRALVPQLFPAHHSTRMRQIAMNKGYAAGRAGRKRIATTSGIVGLGVGGGGVALMGGGGSTQFVPVPQTLPPGMSEEEFARLLEAHNANGNLPAGTPEGTTNNTQENKGSIVPWLLGLTAIGGLGLGAYSLMNSKDNSSKSITDVRDMEQELEAERERRRRRKQLAAYTAANTSVEDRKMLPAPEPKEEVTYAF